MLRRKLGQRLLRLTPDKCPRVIQQPLDRTARAKRPQPAEGHHRVRHDIFVTQEAHEQRYRSIWAGVAAN